jgi:hypothetical protein
MAKKARKKTAVKRKTKAKVARGKKVAAKTKARAAAGKTKKKAAKKRARKPKSPTIGERVSSAVKAVMETFTETEAARKKSEPRGSDAAE